MTHGKTMTTLTSAAATGFSVLTEPGTENGTLPPIPGAWNRKFAEYQERLGKKARSRAQILEDVGLAPTYWSRFNHGTQTVWRHHAQHIADQIGCKLWDLVQDPAGAIDERLRCWNERRDAKRVAEEALRDALATYRLSVIEPDGADGYERLVRDAADQSVSARILPPPERLSDIVAARLVREFRQHLTAAATEVAGRAPGDTLHDIAMGVRDLAETALRAAGLTVLVGRYVSRTLDDEEWSVVRGDNVSLRKQLVIRIAAAAEIDALRREGLPIDRWALHGEALAESYTEQHGEHYERFLDGIDRWLGGPITPSAHAVTQADDALDAYERANSTQREG